MRHASPRASTRRGRHLRSILALLVVSACSDGAPTDPLSNADDVPVSEFRAPIGSIDAVPGFRFLGPIGSDVVGEGELMVELLPTLAVEVCMAGDDACAFPVVRLTHEGTDHERLRLHIGADGLPLLGPDGSFGVKWRVPADADTTLAYRLVVRDGQRVLATVPLRLVPYDARPKHGTELIVQVDHMLPVKFRVERGGNTDVPGGLRFVESTLVAGQVMELLGAQVPAGAGDLSLLVGDEPAPVRMLDDGRILAAAPFFWPAPPAGPLDLLLLANGEPIARGDDAVTVTAAPDAPGAAQQAYAQLATIAGAWGTFAAESDEVSVENGWMHAAAAALEALVDGDAPGSLRSALESADAETLRFLDAWFASSGLLDALEQYAAALDHLAQADAAFVAAEAGSPQRAPGDVGTQLPANTLARKMQLYEIVRLLGETVVGETSTEFGNTVGLATGALGLVITVPAAAAAGIVGAILSISDFIVNRLMVGLLPAKVDELLLEIPDADLDPGEETIAEVSIQASNDPPPITVQDVVSQSLTVMGLVPGPDAESIEQVMTQAAHYFFTTLQSLVSQYAGAHPELNMDIEVTSLPNMVWWSNVLDETLVEPFTSTPDFVTPVAGGIDWRALDDAHGEGQVYVRTALGSGSHRLDPPPGISYHGGAFGDDVVQSGDVTLNVGGDLALKVDFAETIARDGFNALEARAGYVGATGDTTWSDGIAIELIVEGGTVEMESGTTDGDGQFITLARLNEESEEIIITVTARDASGESIDVTVEAELEREEGRIEVVVIYNGWTISAQADAAGSDFGMDHDSDFEFIYDIGSLVGSSAVNVTSGGANARASLTHSGEYEAVDDSVLLRGRVIGDVDASATGSSADNSRSGATSDLHLTFWVHDHPVWIVIEGTGSLQGRGNARIVLDRTYPGATIQFLDYEHSGNDVYFVYELEPGYLYNVAAVINAGGWAGHSSGVTAGTARHDVTIQFLTAPPEGFEVE